MSQRKWLRSKWAVEYTTYHSVQPADLTTVCQACDYDSIAQDGVTHDEES